MALKKGQFTLVRSGSSQETYAVKGVGSDIIKEYLKERNIPWNKIYFGSGVTYVKMPKGAFGYATAPEQKYVDPLGQGISIDPSLAVDQGMSIKQPTQIFKPIIQQYVQPSSSALRQDVFQAPSEPIHPTLSGFSKAEREALGSYPISSYIESKTTAPLPSHPGAAITTWVGQRALSTAVPFVKGAEFIAKGPLALRFAESYISQPYSEKQRLAEKTAESTKTYVAEHPAEFIGDVAISALLTGGATALSKGEFGFTVPKEFKVTMLSGLEKRTAIGKLAKTGEEIFGKKALIPETYEIVVKEPPKLPYKIEYEPIGFDYIRGFAEDTGKKIELQIRRDYFKPVGETYSPGSRFLPKGVPRTNRPYVLEDISTPPPAPEPVRTPDIFKRQPTDDFIKNAGKFVGEGVPEKGPKLSGKPPIQRVKLSEQVRPKAIPKEDVPLFFEEIPATLPRGWTLPIGTASMSSLLGLKGRVKIEGGTRLRSLLVPRTKIDVFTDVMPISKSGSRLRLKWRMKLKEDQILKIRTKQQSKYKLTPSELPFKLTTPKGPPFRTKKEDKLFKEVGKKFFSPKPRKGKKTKMKSWLGEYVPRTTGLPDIIFSAARRRKSVAAGFFGTKRRNRK